jgi:hypothetical protein
MSEAPRCDFPAVSFRRQGDRPGAPRPGEVVEEDLFEHEGGDWRKGEHGRPNGTVTLTHAAGQGGLAVVARFEFADEDVVEFEGAVPGGGSWKGRGRLRYRSGTGKFSEPRGELEVDSTNPKLWG